MLVIVTPITRNKVIVIIIGPIEVIEVCCLLQLYKLNDRLLVVVSS